MRRRTRHLFYRGLFWLGLLVMTVGLTGELLGWFDAAGVVLASAGVAASVVGLLTDEFDGLRRGQRRTHANQEGMLDNQEGMLDNQEQMLENQEGMLGNQESMLENQEQMLENQEGMLEIQQGMLENQETMVGQLQRIGDILDERLPAN